MAEVKGDSHHGWVGTVRDSFGWLIGAGVGLYSGVHLLIPLVLTITAWWVGKKFLAKTNQQFLAAISLQAGHTAWITFGLLVTATLDPNFLDLVVTVVALAWLIKKPGLWPVVVLTCFHILGLGANLSIFMHAEPSSYMHKALVVHMILRATVLFLVWEGYFRFKKVVANESSLGARVRL